MTAQKTPVKKKPGRPAKQPKAPPPLTKAQQVRFEKKQAEALSFATGVVAELFNMPAELRKGMLDEMKKEDPIIHALVREAIREQALAAKAEEARKSVKDAQEEVQTGTFNVPGGPTIGYTLASNRAPKLMGAQSAPPTEAQKLFDRIEAMAQRLEINVDLLRDKLSPVILPTPGVLGNPPPLVPEAMPPFFCAIHNMLDKFNDQIIRVRNIVEDVRV